MSNLDIKKFAESLTRDRRTLEMFRYLVTNSYIRMIQYQNTASMDADRFENEIAAYAEHFCPVTTEDLDRFFETRKWPKKKPGLVIALFDGLRNQYDVMYPLLEKYGLRSAVSTTPVGSIMPHSSKSHILLLLASNP